MPWHSYVQADGLGGGVAWRDMGCASRDAAVALSTGVAVGKGVGSSEGTAVGHRVGVRDGIGAAVAPTCVG